MYVHKTIKCNVKNYKKRKNYLGNRICRLMALHPQVRRWLRSPSARQRGATRQRPFLHARENSRRAGQGGSHARRRAGGCFCEGAQSPPCPRGWDHPLHPTQSKKEALTSYLLRVLLCPQTPPPKPCSSPLFPCPVQE